MRTIYRVRWSAKYKVWNAYTQRGYSSILFPGIAGDPSLPSMLARIKAHIERAKAIS